MRYFTGSGLGALMSTNYDELLSNHVMLAFEYISPGNYGSTVRSFRIKML